MPESVNEPDSCVVEQAKGALMLRYGIGSRESHVVLERWSHDAGVPVEEVARALVHGICLGEVGADTEATVRWLEQRLRGEIGDVREPGAPPAPRTSDAGVARAGTRSGGPSGGRAGTAAGATAGSTPGEGAVGGPVPASARAVVGPRQWRYSSAVHAARVLHGR